MNAVKHQDFVIQKCKDTELMLRTILHRRSIRTFENIPLKQEHVELINEYLSREELLKGPFDRSFRIEFIDRGPMKKNANIGTYGYVKDPQAYLVGMAENDKITLFEIAYVFHGLVLFLTAEGIGTCWLGGIFNQNDVRASIYVAENEIVPAISPIGYIKDGTHLFGKLAKKILKPHKRKPVEEIAFLGDFNTPFNNQQDLLYDVIYLATLAPSAQNKQSWRVVVSEDYSKVHLYVKFKLKKQIHDRFRGYACPPEYLDIGIFYRHFELAMKSHGINGKLELDDPGLELPSDDIEYIISWKMKDV
jgi:nitroreductase